MKFPSKLDQKKTVQGSLAKSGVKIKSKNSLANHSRFVLIVGDDGAILVYMEGSTVVRRLFAPTASAEHTRAMTELMAQHANAPLTLLMDVIDQQYTRHTFPPVSSFSVDGLVNRRLERDFAVEDIKGAVRLGRETGLRKDWIYLLVSLVNTSNFQQWLGLVVEMPNRFSGIQLVPIETSHYINMLSKGVPNRPQPEAEWKLLLSHHKIGGFRMVVLREGKLVFTRVAQAIGETTANILAGNVEQEIQNSIDYIRRLGYNENAGLEVFAVVAAEVRDAIEPKKINASAMHLFSPFDVAELLDIKQAALAADRYGDVVIAAAISQIKKPILTLQTRYSKKLSSFYKMQSFAKIGAVLLSVIFLVLAASDGLSAFESSSTLIRINNEVQTSTKARDALNVQVTSLGKEVSMKSDITTFLEFQKPLRYLPYDVIEELSNLQTSDIKISQITWAHSGDASATPASPDAKIGDVNIQVKAMLNKTFPDNDSVITAIKDYKKYVTSAIKHYDVVLQSTSAISKDAKVSMAVGDLTKDAGNTSPIIIDVSLVGPKPDTDEAASSPSGAQP